MALPPPHEVRATFSGLMKADPERAVAYLHGLGVSSGYIKENRRNIRWTQASPYGDIECTINLAKPEKDPRAIAAEAPAATDAAPTYAPSGSDATHPDAAAAAAPTDGTAAADTSPQPTARRGPKCDLCWENEGFPGTPEHPAKPGLRIAAITLGGECWGLQYSPYAYFPEHCIALSREHRPMKIDEACFERLLDFVDAFPFYFIGSNADLPIVGGSILSHDHFQGGRYEFPLMKASVERRFPLEGFPAVQCGIVKWPASVLRLCSEDRAALTQAASKILNAWRIFSDEACGIVAFDGSPHNTLNPIVRKKGSTYIMDLVLRNNRTDARHPWGIFHVPESMHHIKKENIGLIEIMGLAILPPRLAEELPLVQQVLVEAACLGLPASEVARRLEAQHTTAPHATWAAGIYTRRAAELIDAVLLDPGAQKSEEPTFAPDAPAAPENTLHPVIRQEVARVFTSILETTGVFKRTDRGTAGWDSFLGSLNS